MGAETVLWICLDNVEEAFKYFKWAFTVITLLFWQVINHQSQTLNLSGNFKYVFTYKVHICLIDCELIDIETYV